jgi:hypothetical protein
MEYYLFTIIAHVPICIFFLIAFDSLAKGYRNERRNMLQMEYSNEMNEEDHRMMYQMEVIHLQELKTSQWNITYLMILLLGALIASTQINALTSWKYYKFLISPLATITFFFHVYQMIEHQFIVMRTRISIQKHRRLYRFGHYWMDDRALKKLERKKESFFCNKAIVLAFIIPISLFLFIIQLLLLRLQSA